MYWCISGPQSWQDRYKVAEGNLQSPINIETANAKDDNIVGPIKFLYGSINNSTLTNDGRHLQVTITKNESGKKRPFVKKRFYWNLVCYYNCTIKLYLKGKIIYNTHNISWQQYYSEIVTKDVILKIFKQYTLCLEEI